MNDNTIYSEIILSKTNLEIPVFKSGKTVDSRYDPERESLRLLEQINSDTHFLIVIGIASGIFIDTILENKKDIFIIGVEKTAEDIEFLKKIQLIKQLSNNKQVSLCTIDELTDKIIEFYIPAFYGNLQVIEQRGWTAENLDCIEQINKSINKATGIVSADFSVQSHFGKLWQHNIFSNLKHIQELSDIQNITPNNKTAVIVAAGPTIDDTIKLILDNKDDYYIIATDTAFSILNSYNIIPQAVFSIDGQNISNIHFIHNNSYEFNQTLFLFDLCANSSAITKVINNKGKICFFTSGHPFCEYINKTFNLGFPSLFSGAGTVTISAVDFAIKAGFEKIIVTGADFSYSRGKPYAKGTYLDRLYNQKSNRIQGIQNKFSTLEFRTELIKDNKRYTTSVLQAYRTSFETYLINNNFQFKKETDLYKIFFNKNENIFQYKKPNTINGQQILNELQRIYKSKTTDKTFNSIFDLSDSDISLLPLISWLRNHDNKDKNDFLYYYQKAVLFCRDLGGN